MRLATTFHSPRKAEPKNNIIAGNGVIKKLICIIHLEQFVPNPFHIHRDVIYGPNGVKEGPLSVTRNVFAEPIPNHTSALEQINVLNSALSLQRLPTLVLAHIEIWNGVFRADKVYHV